MPVYDYTYKTWEGVRRGPLFRWLAIPKFTYIELFQNRLFIWLFSLAWLQVLLRLTHMYLLVNLEFLKVFNIPTQALPPIDAFVFKSTIDVQIFFCFALAFMIGSGLISRDLRYSAVVLYMSKPISRWEYFLGKFAALFSVLIALTWLQIFLLFAVQTAIVPEDHEWRLYFWRSVFPDGARASGIGPFRILISSTLYSVVLCAAMTLLIMAASSLTKNSRYAGTTFAGHIIGSAIFAAILHGITDKKDVFALSIFNSGMQLGEYLFSTAEDHDMSQAATWVGVLGVCAMCLWIIHLRLTGAAKYGR